MSLGDHFLFEALWQSTTDYVVQSIHTTVTAKADRLCERQAQLQKPKKPPFFCTDKHDTAALRTRQHFSSSRRYLDKASKNAPPRNRPHLTKESRADRPGKGEKGSVQEGGILWTQPATTPALGLLEVTTTRVSADQYSLVEEDEVEEEQQPAIIMAETLPLLPWCICCAMVCCCRLVCYGRKTRESKTARRTEKRKRRENCDERGRK